MGKYLSLSGLLVAAIITMIFGIVQGDDKQKLQLLRAETIGQSDFFL